MVWNVQLCGMRDDSMYRGLWAIGKGYTIYHSLEPSLSDKNTHSQNTKANIGF